MKRGVEIFANWADVSAPRTLDVLRASGAVRCIAMVQRAIDSDATLRSRRGAVLDLADRCADEGIEVTLCTGPAVIEHAEPLACRDRLAQLCAELACPPMLDAEPVHVGKPGEQRWSPPRLAPWLELPGLQITTTRAEAPRLGQHGRRTYAQLEQQTSTATLAQAMRIFERYTDLSRVVPTIGSFDQPGDPRTLAELRADLDRCTAQALAAGGLAAWVAATTSTAECDALREWSARVWPG